MSNTAHSSPAPADLARGIHPQITKYFRQLNPEQNRALALNRVRVLTSGSRSQTRDRTRTLPPPHPSPHAGINNRRVTRVRLESVTLRARRAELCELLAPVRE